MTAEDNKFMQAALDQAHQALECGEIPIGAVVVCRGRIVATGHNMTETLSDPTAHAEMIALTAACDAIGGKYLNDCTLYVTVEPCPMCAAALGWAQLGRLVYGAADPKRGYSQFRQICAETPSSAEALSGPEAFSTPVSPGALAVSDRGLLHPRTAVESGVMEDECSSIMKSFFASKR